MRKIKLLSLFLFVIVFANSQNIREHVRNVSAGIPSDWYNNRPGSIIYPTGYSTSSSKTPVIFVHGIFGKVSGSYAANIEEVKNYRLKAAFVQLNKTGSTVSNGKLLSRMIDKVRAHYKCQTVSIVAHSKGGLDTERALYGQNAYVSYPYPTHSYEKVDAVYTLSSPLRGSRTADLGSTLSIFRGIVWATMWYTNGWSLTSGTVNSFHNSADNWRVTSNGTFKNYYNPYGRSYVRNNLSQDNTTRWWAHQSNDECYRTSIGWVGMENMYCYIGRPFHHTVGAYLDAYWEWDWFNSGFRNWYSDSDGFISEYRAKRVVNPNTSPQFTPGAGDSNYRTMLDGNHTSLWEPFQNHFSNEIGPYLHNGLFNFYAKDGQNNNLKATKLPEKEAVKSSSSQIMASSGNIYYANNKNADLIVEENNQAINLIVYSENAVKEIALINKQSRERHLFNVEFSNKDIMSSAYASVANIIHLEKGVYELETAEKDYLALANYNEGNNAFAVDFNFNEKDGYNGEHIKIGIVNRNNALDFDQVSVKATLSQVTIDDSTPIKIDDATQTIYNCKSTGEKGFYTIAFQELIPGGTYSLRIEAISKKGNALLARNVIHTFYVKKEMEMQESVVLLDEAVNELPAFVVNIFPNPATNNVHIENYSKTIMNNIELINDKGDVIKTFEVNAIDSKLNIKSLNLPTGLYMLRINTNHDSVVKKLYIK